VVVATAFDCHPEFGSSVRSLFLLLLLVSAELAKNLGMSLSLEVDLTFADPVLWDFELAAT